MAIKIIQGLIESGRGNGQRELQKGTPQSAQAAPTPTAVPVQSQGYQIATQINLSRAVSTDAVVTLAARSGRLNDEGSKLRDLDKAEQLAQLIANRLQDSDEYFGTEAHQGLTATKAREHFK